MLFRSLYKNESDGLILSWISCTIYDSALVPFRSVLVGFNVAFHTPPSSTARVKDCQLQLVFHGPEGLPPPVIKALAPSSSVGSTSLGLPLTVTYDKSITGVRPCRSDSTAFSC